MVSQFHYGSIKTNREGEPIGHVDYLNSTMVRLKRIGLKYADGHKYNLNSTMVRLKLF